VKKRKIKAITAFKVVKRKEIENRRFRSSAVTLIQNFIFVRLVRPMNCLTTLPLTVFTQRNFHSPWSGLILSSN